MDTTRIGRRVALGLGAGALLVGTIAGPAFAADTVAQTVNPGTGTATDANLTLTVVSYSHSAPPAPARG